MMDRNYPTPSFPDPLVPPAQTAAWAYERSTTSIKPSCIDPAGVLSELAVLTYPLKNGLSGLFDAGLHTGSNPTDTSVMNFLSALESRNPQTGAAAASLLPQFRTPSWQTGMHSSAAAELFVTGAIPAPGTFAPTSALSAYQHPNTFSMRNFATAPSLTLQDASFSPSSNGLLSPHDPLMQMKAAQGTVPAALPFDRIGSTVLSTSIPPQSSTYRSAQESAPHLLQPQFSLLPSALGGGQQVSQPYSTPIFTGSTASIERALQRECSVIKHHQRPSSTQSVQAQLSSAQHSLQGYLTSGSGVSFQDPSRQPALPCSPLGDNTQVSNGGPQQKASQATLEQTQAYPSTIPSPGYSSTSATKAKDCSTKRTQCASKTTKSQSVSPNVQPQSYSASAQKQSTVIASQPQAYSSAQLPNLINSALPLSVRPIAQENHPSLPYGHHDDERQDHRALNHISNPDFAASGRSISDESAASENEYNLVGEDYDPAGLLNKAKRQIKPKLKAQAHLGGTANIKIEEGMIDFSPDGFPKKKSKAKGSVKLIAENENGNPKPMKRSGQGKRQNSRGSDANSPSTSDSCYDSYQHQERIRQKIREVEEKQPEVKTGFIASFLDFLKSGPKQQFCAPAVRTPNRTRKPPITSIRPPFPPPPPAKPQPLPVPLMSSESGGGSAPKKLEDDLKKNLETLPSFSSDEDDSVGKNQDLQQSITSALSALDEPSEKKMKSEQEANLLAPVIKQEQQPPGTPLSILKTQEPPPLPTAAESTPQDELKDIPSDQRAVKQASAAIEGSTDEENSDSGGEGMYRERDEFVVKIEDIDSLKITLKAGIEPPAIWKVQKALLQKFVPELRNGNRVFSATNSYLGYFGDAKTKYKRVYVKFLDTVNKKEYVRVCNRKPRCKPVHSMRSVQPKFSNRPVSDSASAPAPEAVVPKAASTKVSTPKAKQQKVKAEPPPKKRKKWTEEFTPSPSESSLEAESEDDEFTPPVPFATRFLNTRTMKETFKSYMELLISVALDADVIEALEKAKDELLLPHVKRVDGMITDNRRRLLPKLRAAQMFKGALDSFPELTVVPDLKKSENTTCKIQLSGKAYNKRTLRAAKASKKLPLEYTVDKDKTQWFSLYHSLQHYKYHTYLMCKDEISAVQKQNKDLGQEETVQLCMRNSKWVETLFEKFGELLTQPAAAFPKKMPHQRTTNSVKRLAVQINCFCILLKDPLQAIHHPSNAVEVINQLVKPEQYPATPFLQGTNNNGNIPSEVFVFNNTIEFMIMSNITLEKLFNDL
ncbi:UNVERIFIED_CONTAM: hypothetical protein FKN15_037554 [Acipenser sinensis]